MTRLIAVFCLAGALAGPGAALGAPRDVSIRSNTFLPKTLNVLVNDTVRWKNFDSGSFGIHKVKSDDGGATFESPELGWNESYESDPLTTAGAIVPYHCETHVFMKGVVRVHEIFLSGPVAVLVYGNAIRLAGLAPAADEVTIERRQGEDWTPVKSADRDGDKLSASITPSLPGQYRASTATASSTPVKVAVKPRVTIAKKRIPRKRFRVTVAANVPTHAGAPVVLQRRAPAGWRALATKRLSVKRKAAFVVAPKKGTWRLRAVVKASGGYAAGQSAVIAVKR